MYEQCLNEMFGKFIAWEEKSFLSPKPQKWRLTPPKRHPAFRPWCTGSVSSVFIKVSLHRHDWMNQSPWIWTSSPGPLPSLEVHLVPHGSKPQPSNHVLVFPAWPAPVWSHLISTNYLGLTVSHLISKNSWWVPGAHQERQRHSKHTGNSRVQTLPPRNQGQILTKIHNLMVQQFYTVAKGSYRQAREGETDPHIYGLEVEASMWTRIYII